MHERKAALAKALLTGLLLGVALPALAVKPAGEDNPGQAKKAERQKVVAKATTSDEIKKPAKKGVLLEKRRENIRRYFKNMKNRIEARLVKLTQLAARIETRIQTLNSQGADTTKAKAAVAKARTSIQKAKDGLTAAATKLETVLTSATPTEAFREVKTLLKEITADVKNAHAQLVVAITNIKGLRVGNAGGAGGTSTTTATTTNP